MFLHEKFKLDKEFFNNKIILVTGGCGFIGSNFIRTLLKNFNSKIFNIDKLNYASDSTGINEIIIQNKNLLESKYKFLKINLEDFELTKAAIEHIKPDIIFNFAAESHVDRSIENPYSFLSSNVTGTFNLLESVRDYYEKINNNKKENFRFHHISTDEVFGTLGEKGLFSEKSQYSPRSPYSASKAASDHLVNSWFHTFGIPTLITNCSNNYGPWQFIEKFIPVIILKAISEETIPIYGSGSNIRDWLFVEDHINALLLVASKGKIGNTYCVGGSNEKTNLDICKAIFNILNNIHSREIDYQNLINFVEDRPGHDQRYAIDPSKIKDELGWEPLLSFEESLMITVRWYLNNIKWCKYMEEKSGYRGERIGIK